MEKISPKLSLRDQYPTSICHGTAAVPTMFEILRTCGIDQRMIEEFTGKMTQEMSRRCRNLFASTNDDTIAKVFS